MLTESSMYTLSVYNLLLELLGLKMNLGCVRMQLEASCNYTIIDYVTVCPFIQ